MAKSSTQPKSAQNNATNMVNANRGTVGTNLAYDQNQSNRGKLLNLTYVFQIRENSALSHRYFKRAVKHNQAFSGAALI